MRFVYKGVPLGNAAGRRETVAGRSVHSPFQLTPFYECFSVSYTSFFSFILQLASAYTPYSGGLYSRHTPLVQKRAERNLHMRTRGYDVGAGTPELRELLERPQGQRTDLPLDAPTGKRVVTVA
jgi:hypothetical protein